MNYTVRISRVCQHIRDFEMEAESKESAEFKALDFAYYQKNWDNGEVNFSVVNTEAA